MANSSNNSRVWINQDRKLEGLCLDLVLARKDGQNVLILAHFQDTLATVEAMLHTWSIEHERLFSGTNAALCNSHLNEPIGRVYVALASHFQPENFLSTETSADERVCVLVAEHHPSGTREQALLDSIELLPCGHRVVIHAALSDALLMYFGGEKIQALMAQMGLKEDEHISHPMINAAIGRAQEKVDKKVRQELPAQSAEEWVRSNVG